MSPRCLLCIFALPLTSCGLFQKPAYQEQGMASYIADHYNGRMTTSGQIYQPHQYTAAHYSLPFGTQVSVRNLQTGRTVNVMVNDRFPYYPGRVINLSSAAAQYIGIPYRRLAQVQVTAQTVPRGAQYQRPRPQHRPASPYQARKQPARTYSNQRLPGYNDGAPAYNGAAPSYNGAAPAYRPAPQPPAYRPPPQAPTYQPQPPAGNNYLPGFNSGVPAAGTGLR